MHPLPIALLAAVALASIGASLATGADSQPAAAIVAMPRFVPDAGPLLTADGGVVWVSRRDDAVLDLWVSRLGQGPRRVQRFVGSDGERLRVSRLSASSTAVGLELDETRPDARDVQRSVRLRAYLGAFGQPLATAVAGLPVASDATGADRVWVARGCESAEIHVTSLLGTLPASEPRCPLRLRSPARVRGGRLRLGVSCAGFSIDCAARVSVRAGGRLVARGAARHNRATPPYAAADLKLTAAGARLLRARPRTRVQITARIGERGLLADPALGGTVTRRTSRALGFSPAHR